MAAGPQSPFVDCTKAGSLDGATRVTKPPRRWRLLRSGFSNWRLPSLLALINHRATAQLGVTVPGLAGVECRLWARSGSTLVARVQDLNAAAEVFGNGEYDLPEIDWTQVNHVLDLGGHVGSFTLWAAQRAPARFVVVEPNPATCELLLRNTQALCGRVMVRQLAVAGRPGRMRLELNDDSASVRAVRDGQATAPGVAAVTLADVARDSAFPSVDLVKMDIEGEEHNVVRSLTPAEVAQVRYWIVECHPVPGGDVTGLAAVLQAGGHQVRVEPKPDGLALVIAARPSGIQALR